MKDPVNHSKNTKNPKCTCNKCSEEDGLFRKILLEALTDYGYMERGNPPVKREYDEKI